MQQRSNAPNLYVRNNDYLFMRYWLHKKRMMIIFWDMLFCVAENGFLEESLRLHILNLKQYVL